MKIWHKKGFWNHIIFLIIITGGTILLSAYYIGLLHEKTHVSEIVVSDIEGRIVKQSYNRNIFVFESKVQTKDGTYKLEHTKPLPLGEKIKINGIFTRTNHSLDNGYQRYLISNGEKGTIQGKINSYSSICDSICILIKQNSRANRWLQTTIRNKICGSLKPIVDYIYAIGPCDDIATFSIGLLINTNQRVSNELDEIMKSAGLSHIVSVSGFQITVLALTLETIARRMTVDRRRGILGGIALIIIYGYFAGPQPPILRALVSTIISSLALLLIGRKVSQFHSTLYSSIILLAVFPHFIISYSFWLSITASFSLILAPKIKLGSDISNEFLQGYISTLSAFLFTFPLVSHFENSFNPILLLIGAIILPVIPLISLTTIFGTIPWIGELLLTLPAVILSLFIVLLDGLRSITPEIIFVPINRPLEIGLYYLLLILGFYGFRFFLSSFRSSFSSVLQFSSMLISNISQSISLRK